MRRFVLLGLMLLLNLVPASKAADDAIPICSNPEFLEIFSLIVEHQVKIDDSFASFQDLLAYNEGQINNRAGSLAHLPYCSDAIAIRRLFVQLGGDAVGRAALELAALPADANPYRLRLPSDHDRVSGFAAALLSVDRSDAPAPEERALIPCEPRDLLRLDAAIGSLLDLLAKTATVESRPHYIRSVDQRLQWRAEQLLDLPDCAESLQLGLLLSESVTDAAAHHALAYAGVSSETNPFINLEAAGVAVLRDWRERIQIMRAPASPVGGSLPSCGFDALTTAYQTLLPYHELRARAAAMQTVPDLISFSQALIAFRENQLSQLPLCAEILNAGWWAGEVIDNLIAGAAASPTASAMPTSPIAERARQDAARAEAGLARITSVLEAEPVASVNAVGAAAACGDSETLYFEAYILPEFRRFLNAALSLSSQDAVGDLLERSFAMRNLLWLHLPRCDEALRNGMLMRGIAADFSAMIALEGAGAAAQDIPYTRAVAANIENLFERLGETHGFSAVEAGNIYFVVAETIANVRACGSIDCAIMATLRRGDALDVLDDSGAWYEIRLEDGGTAYIAGFLASKTRP